jgi:Tfp pilus assembly protein PilN
MINLLPPDLKQGYKYARYNRRLLHWIVAFVVAIAGVAAITVSGMFLMQNSINTYKSRISSAEAQLASQNLTSIQSQVTTISNNLKLMVKVLSKEILFSKLLTQLGAVTPPNVELTGLTISQAQSAIIITAQAANYNAATQLQANLASPSNQIFSKSDLVSVTCVSGASLQALPNPNYPCTVNIQAVFMNNNPFLFINASGQKAGS